MRISGAFVVFLLSVSLAANGFAENSIRSLSCDKENVCHIVRPIKNDKGQDIALKYYFGYRAPQKGAPTVVFIPGGPGQTAIDMGFDTVGVPADFGIILIDPAFIGKNTIENTDDFRNSFHSEQVANDVALAIKAVQAEHNYIVYGVSYGTIIATLVGANRDLLPAKAVLLAGTVGRSYANGEYQKNTIKIFNKYKAQMDPRVWEAFLATLNKAIDEEGLTRSHAGMFLQLVTMVDFTQFNTFLSFMSIDPELLKEMVEEVTSGFLKDMHTDEALNFHYRVACGDMYQELPMTSDNITFTITPEGNLVEATEGKRGNACEILAVPFRGYDSAKHQIRGSVIYTQGGNDPATNINQYRYHVEAQREASLYRVFSANGGHAVLERELSDCKERFWQGFQHSIDEAVGQLRQCVPQK